MSDRRASVSTLSISNLTNFICAVDQETVEKLYHHFIRIDKDGNGFIDRTELFKVPTVSENPLASRIIEVMDLDQEGKIDFKEFVSSLSIFSKNTSRLKKLRFAFDIYDLDRDGQISNGELYLALKMMSGDHLKSNELQQVVDKTIRDADLDLDGKISFIEFVDLIESKNSEFLASWNLRDL